MFKNSTSLLHGNQAKAIGDILGFAVYRSREIRSANCMPREVHIDTAAAHTISLWGDWSKRGY